VASDVLDEAYVRLHHWGPEFGGEIAHALGYWAARAIFVPGLAAPAARTADPALLAAATHCAELINPPR
jgi:hypothetical protein